MQIKLIRTPRHGQIDMVLKTPVAMREFVVGQAVEVDEQEGKWILASQFGSCFAAASVESPKPVAATKVMGSTKSSRKHPKEAKIEDEALEEATKMVDDYAVKG